MKLRRIRLENVRRFSEPVEIGPLSDGVSLLCEPNEAGKSTLFDALHALFFQRHTGWPKEVQGLQPRSGGKVAVGCEMEIDGVSWRLRKQWQKGSGGEARLWRDGALEAQGDAVEDWLHARITGAQGGPAGLLWVRQGRVRVDVDKRDKAASAEEQDARRDLLTAISGAMDDVTGGERMDRALSDVTAELAALETKRGAKAGGAWAEAEASVAHWDARREELRAQVAMFREALDEMRRTGVDLAALEDEGAEAERRRKLAEAAMALEAARRHADRVAGAEATARLARRELEAGTQALARDRAARADLAEATEAEARLAAATEAAGARADSGASAIAEAERAAALAGESARAAEDRLNAARKRAAAMAAADTRARLSVQLDRADAAEDARIAAAARAAQGPDARRLAEVEGLLQRRDAQRALRAAAAPTVTFEGAPDGAVTLDGQPLEPGQAVSLSTHAEIGLAGLGRLRIAVPETGGSALAEAEAALRRALSEGDWPDIEALRRAARAAADAANEAEAQRRTREALAPDGIAALREALARLPQPISADEEEEFQDLADLEAAADAARAEAEAGEQAAARARAAGEAARIAAAEAAAELRAARSRLETARRAVAELPDPPTDLEAREAALAEAEAVHDALLAEAPDLEATEARHARLLSMAEQRQRQIATLRETRARLRERIDQGGEAGLEEALAEAETRAEDARAGLDRILFERDTLRCLRDALQEARSEARDAYFAPVARELRPLLADLWGEAELEWSEDTLLPVALRRRGAEEPLDILSGGTQEQIAFLVRLAFARLLARAGRPAPLILDDALVYSDDDRIEKMFDALHRAAGDIQILVLSCRQRAFTRLGAPQVRFEPV
ncbi:AAA family ATPase [Jannaschia seohaensis]|uniref:DNA repair exonuclease SbcCD ATPase subunit n=1 Tax=Jannaschia seohaensis TaxID=475081 RepID=A0A2Y9AME6_9RHOB|nr:ATP-binding protein [Jannaschia seohaensis]PWJ20432.1 DNA repair exonuclease SbcCD ATPase subunit [Jannaschia seohaensis]SSA44518.1 DNA repair exonuclease SbcCD ATPase subunit [Jannaschia seohaensis]